MFGSFLPSALGWFGSHQSLLGYRSRHCHGINFTNNPSAQRKEKAAQKTERPTPERIILLFEAPSKPQWQTAPALATNVPSSENNPPAPIDVESKNQE